MYMYIYCQMEIEPLIVLIIKHDYFIGLLSELLLKYLTGTGGLSGRRGRDLILLSLYLILKDIPLPLHQEITGKSTCHPFPYSLSPSLF